jgi:YidC/Oxa1 family membrane protein insertase
VALAALIKAAMWPLNVMQFKSMLAMQELSPKLKALQAKYGNDREKLNEQTMALYKDKGVNPLAGCFPLLLQLPVLYSVFYAITADKDAFAKEGWLWIGSSLAAMVPNHLLGASLASADYLLLGIYVVSMYFSVRFTSPPSADPQVAQQQRIMAFVSPAMIGFIGIKYAWPSGLIVYWLSFNVFTMAQQLYMINKYHRNPTAVGPHPELEAAKAAPAPSAPAGAGSKNPAAGSSSKNGGGGSRAARRRRGSRR